MLRKQRAVRFQSGAVMLESTHVAQNGFERGLAALAQLGLVRPANVLLAEYLAALTAEEILDATTAERLSAVYNRVRYSAVSADDPELQEAVATLESVAARLTAWSADERRQVVRRVRAIAAAANRRRLGARDGLSVRRPHTDSTDATRKCRPAFLAPVAGGASLAAAAYRAGKHERRVRRRQQSARRVRCPARCSCGSGHDPSRRSAAVVARIGGRRGIGDVL